MNGLSAWEQVWEEWFIETRMTDLPTASVSHLPACVPSERELWLQSARFSLQQKLRSHIPVRIVNLLGPEYLEELLLQMPRTVIAHSLGPSFSLALLLQLNEQIQQEGLLIPHLSQVLNFEIALLQRVFYRLPPLFPAEFQPLLSDWVCLISGGPFFIDILEWLRLGQPLPACSELPLQDYLLIRDMAGSRLEALPSDVAECLKRCNGKSAWEEIVAEVLNETSDPQLGAAALKDWGNYLIKRGILKVSAEHELRMLINDR
ncbi:hypothetical protein COW36_01965 [bacterium (Candidatus Blackallbacteria) CG17_big_fil_post_rev_8_21_14_2_50_48_46]|uniref:DNA-binding domain-containing protein n=1 Tax=bacterium (Candidatus Blackallbacteria) CG17_big_fil_post_rev_8_21_14_2_50_48_46 TaxID=2014261 RepID=A0A2M7GAM1_9BACT|nr:MAG: hypothetical protein COW64_26355 [bacterium (Candidatus Blackallbacteria) CG18_big_fil_WC_8_21_14_2_50_49_26]PIW19200.1 MAG: hypothetical protein COW36_01965 [bacterium (Candidatus Blackallbacteria) CG17_big_fil_post_rev_8_21_14_2_50_48_46]PIW45450.1 MAG: hypothetical protein COW20_20175 [bacterium (Candidatus Blackallbacteria) CG13_big_fil_rev_8_21_14_2_50_49_14]